MSRYLSFSCVEMKKKKILKGEKEKVMKSKNYDSGTRILNFSSSWLTRHMFCHSEFSFFYRQFMFDKFTGVLVL